MDAVAFVGQGGSTRHVRTDMVTLNDVARNITANNGDAVAIIAGNEVALSRFRPSNRLAAGAGPDHHATAAVADSGCARDIRADAVALHPVACLTANHLDAKFRVAGD